MLTIWNAFEIVLCIWCCVRNDEAWKFGLLNDVKLWQRHGRTETQNIRCGRQIKSPSTIEFVIAQSRTNGTQSFIRCEVLSQLDILMQICAPFSHHSRSPNWIFLAIKLTTNFGFFFRSDFLSLLGVDSMLEISHFSLCGGSGSWWKCDDTEDCCKYAFGYFSGERREIESKPIVVTRKNQSV